MGIPLEDFLRNQQAYRAQQARVSYDEKTRSRVSSKDLTTRFQATRVSTSDETTRSQVSSDVPEHSGGVITNQRKHRTEWIVSSRTQAFSYLF